MKHILLLLVLFCFISCSKDDKTPEENDNPADTNLTPGEKFSVSILSDFLDDSDDEDLASFLETQIYKMGTGYNGAAVVEITPSTWLVMLEKDGNTKNYLLQKYVDFKTNEYYFTFKETQLTLTDIITKGKTKTSAGE